MDIWDKKKRSEVMSKIGSKIPSQSLFSEKLCSGKDIDTGFM